MSLNDNQMVTPQTDSKKFDQSYEQNELTVPIALNELQCLIAQPVFDQNYTSPVDDAVEKRYFKLALLFFVLGFFTWILWIISILYAMKSKRKETRILGDISIALFVSFIFIVGIIVPIVGGNLAEWLGK